MACRAWRHSGSAFAIRLRHTNAWYAKKASGSNVARATPAQLWPVVCSIGGDTGCFYGSLLWTLRAWMDWLVGGQGLSKGQRHPAHLNDELVTGSDMGSVCSRCVRQRAGAFWQDELERLLHGSCGRY